jgi:hypothetical protein
VTELQAFFAAPEGIALYGVIVIGLADFIIGVSMAVRDGTFRMDAVAAWLRKHLAGRIAPIVGLLALGSFGAQPALSLLAAAWAAGYLAETLASIQSSISTNTKQAVPED